MGEQQILFEIIHESEIDDVVNFTMKYFFTDEPICYGLGLSIDQHVQDYWREVFKVIIPQHLSIKATDPVSKELLGLMIATKYDPEELPIDDSESDLNNRHRHNKLIGFLNQIVNMSEFGDEFPSDGVFEQSIVSTKTEARQKKIGRMLIERSAKLAENAGFKYIKAVATGAYSRRIFERHGFNAWREWFYEGFKLNGEELFINEVNIHKSSVVMLKKLD